jgi:hypothetical protein
MDHALNLPADQWLLCAFTRSLIKSIFSLLILFLLCQRLEKKSLQAADAGADVLLSGNESHFTMLIPCITVSSA